MYDVITIGDSIFDIFSVIHDAEVRCFLRPKECQLCVDYGDKIPITKMVKVPGGGNAANVAVALRALGLKTTIYTHIGSDIEGEQIKANFKKRQVDTRYIKKETGKISSTSCIITFRKERTVFSYHQKWNYQLPKLSPAKLIYLTSCGSNFEKLYRQTINYAKKNKIKLAFNPGSRQVRSGLAKIKNAIAASYFLVLNREEAAKISRQKTNLKAQLKFFSQIGAQNIVITDGRKGAYGYDGKNYIFVNARKVKTAEKSGAGDAFTTGAIAALIAKKSLKEAIIWGVHLSGAVVQKVGAQEGLLSQKELLQSIKKHWVKSHLL